MHDQRSHQWEGGAPGPWDGPRAAGASGGRGCCERVSLGLISRTGEEIMRFAKTLFACACTQVIILNAPLGSGLVWKAASVFLPASTRQKIAILPRGGHGQAELLRLACARLASSPAMTRRAGMAPSVPASARQVDQRPLPVWPRTCAGSRPAVMCLCACGRLTRRGRGQGRER